MSAFAPSTNTRGEWDIDPRDAAIVVLGLVAFVLSPPMLLCSLVGSYFVWRNRRKVLIWALAGAALVAIFYAVGLVETFWLDPLERAARPGLISAISRQSRSVNRLFPELAYAWFLFLPLAPLFAIPFDLLSEKTAKDELKRQELGKASREKRRLSRAGRKLQKQRTKEQAAASQVAQGPPSFGHKLAGESVLPAKGRNVYMPLKVACHSMVVIGATGAGKTESLLRMAYCMGRSPKRPFQFFIDAKGDREVQGRYLSSMQALGYRCLAFPQEAISGWRGGPREIASRLMQVVPFSREGDGAWHTDRTRAVVELACQGPPGPPTSSEDFLRRLNKQWMLDAYHRTLEGEAAKRLPAEAYESAWTRFRSFFSFCDGLLDGERSFEDVDAAYFCLDSAAEREQAEALARYLGGDYLHFVTKRKGERNAVLYWDEFSALTRADEAIHIAERARSVGGGVVLASQSVEALGDEQERARLLMTVGTAVLHRCPDPEQVVTLAGTRRRVESSAQHIDGLPTGVGSARIQEAFRVDPNDVRRLADGAAWVIRSGAAMKVKVALAPEAPPYQATANSPQVPQRLVPPTSPTPTPSPRF